MTEDAGSDFESITLDSGLILTYSNHLQGGGNTARYDFIDILTSIGKTYKNGFEWCAGHGIIGFEMLTKNFCENIYFSDIFPPAIDNCLRVAKENNISDRVFAYVSPTIKDLPVMQPIDLVVSNPPHHSDINLWNKTLFPDQDVSNVKRYDRSIRIGVDDQFKIHEEFFANIAERLSDDADIFLSESGISQPIIDIAKKYNFICVKIYENKKTQYNGETIHFKVKNK